MKIAVFSDIHGNLPALESIIKSIKNSNVDKIICLGDVIGLGPSPKECLDLIIKENIDMVLGNHELYCLYGSNIDKNIQKEEKKHHNWVKTKLTDENINFLRKCKLQIIENNILFEHFLQQKKIKYPFYDTNIINKKISDEIDNTYIFVGHVHKKFKKNGKLIGIGSSGCTKNNITSYYIIDTNNYTYEIINVKYDREMLKQLLNKENYPDKDFIANVFFGIK